MRSIEKRWLLLLILVATLFALVPEVLAAAETSGNPPFPRPVESYQDGGSLPMRLISRVIADPLNLIATMIFFLAIAHTFLTSIFLRLAHSFESKVEALEKGKLPRSKLSDREHDRLVFRAQLFHFMGEVEAVFGIWLIPLFVAIVALRGWSTMVEYVGHADVAEPIFVVVIMAIASSLPVLRLAESLIARIARLGRDAPAAWWLSVLTFGPLLGSFITEPAAMTISALILRHRFYNLKPSSRLKYATLGLLFVNTSVGGTLSHFAAPPVVLVAQKWKWDLMFMVTHFGWKAVIGIALGNLLYFFLFRRELLGLTAKSAGSGLSPAGERPIPGVITVISLLFLVWTVVNSHYSVLVILGFLFFLAFVSATRRNQHAIALRPPLLVGFFLASLVIHGGCQSWWIAPVLGSLGRWPLMIGATILTAFNDNAAIAYLATLVPSFTDPLKYAVMAGALTGGGLTVIANAPNPAGQSILASRFGDEGISPLGLFAAALVPTIIAGACFMLLG
jgi:Putative Na+/H+ antiporter